MASIELAIGPGEESGSCRVQVLESDDGLASAEVRLDVASLSARRRELEKAVIASAVPNPADPSSTNPLRDIGQTLFTALLGPADIAGPYAVSVAKAREEGQGLRVVLRIDTPELARLPWESMYDTGRGAYVCRRDQLVRRVPAPGAARLKVQPPLRILGIVSSPGDREPLNVEQEKQLLTQALSAPSEKGLIELHWAPQATWQALQNQLLLHGPWHVLHFIGHGSFDTVRDQGVLDLTGADGNAHPVVADDLVDLLGQASRMPSLVVLNSCEGAATAADDLFAGTAYALVRGGVSAVAAMQYSISDTAASAFTQGFYDAIAGGRGVDEATRIGRIAILGTPGTLEWVTPVMYLRGDETHLFDLESPSTNGEQLEKSPVIRPLLDSPRIIGWARLRRPLRRARREWARRPVIMSILAVAAVITLVGGGGFAAWKLLHGSPPYRLITTIPVGKHPWQVAVDQAAHKVYVACAQDAKGKVSEIDETKSSVTRSWDVGSRPSGVAVDSAARTIYVADFRDAALSQIVTDEQSPASYPVPVGIYPQGVAVDPTTDSIYVVGDPGPGAPPGSPGMLVVMSRSDFSNPTAVSVGKHPHGVAVDPDTRTIYVSNFEDGTLSVITGQAYDHAETLPVGAQPENVAVEPHTHTVYVANSASHSVTVVDGGRVKQDIQVGPYPNGVAIDYATHTVYVANNGSNTLSVIDESTNTVKTNVPVGKRPSDVAVDQVSHTVYVSNYDDGTVSVIQP